MLIYKSINTSYSWFPVCVWTSSISLSGGHGEGVTGCGCSATHLLLSCYNRGVDLMQDGLEVLVVMVTTWLISPCPVRLHIQMKIRSVTVSLSHGSCRSVHSISGLRIVCSVKCTSLDWLLEQVHIGTVWSTLNEPWSSSAESMVRLEWCECMSHSGADQASDL